MSFQKNTAAIFTAGSVLVLLTHTAFAATACYKLLAPIGTFTSGGCYTLKDYLEGIFTTIITASSPAMPITVVKIPSRYSLSV